MVRLAQVVGAEGELRSLTGDEVRARCDSPAFGGGAFMRDGASIQPARLARGLRRVLLERGVTIHEGTRVSRLVPGSEAAAVTPRGIVRAPHAVIAINAWPMDWPELRRRRVAWGTYICLTSPPPHPPQPIPLPAPHLH